MDIFKRMRQAAAATAKAGTAGLRGIVSMARAFVKEAEGWDSCDPEYVRAMLPDSWFTKTHTRGVVKNLRIALASMTPVQREVCYAKGWVRR
jgi:hypothetical protein